MLDCLSASSLQTEDQGALWPAGPITFPHSSALPALTRVPSPIAFPPPSLLLILPSCSQQLKQSSLLSVKSGHLHPLVTSCCSSNKAYSSSRLEGPTGSASSSRPDSPSSLTFISWSPASGPLHFPFHLPGTLFHRALPDPSHHLSLTCNIISPEDPSLTCHPKETLLANPHFITFQAYTI